MRFHLYISLIITALLYADLNAQLSPHQAAVQMQKGINLGNTLEPPLEGGWNNPPAQEYYFDLYRQAGFNTVRIPVRWDQHTQTGSPYTITASWLLRVEQLVDWALERDLFVVINAHHDDWIKQNYSNPEMRARFDSIWSQIAVHFSDKPEKLLFEVLNEPYGLTKAQNDDMHARILGIIRKTNPTRIVIFQGHNWGGSDELIAAAIPDDDYIMGSFHSYDPYLFGLEGQGTWGTTGDYTILENKFKAVSNWSVTHNIPVFLGEFGSLRKCDYNSRMKHYRAYVELSQKYGFVACAWDDGGDFRIMERSARKWDEVKDILIFTNLAAPRITLQVQDTLIQISWRNASTADSVFVQYRINSTTYKTLASLPADSSEWNHTDAAFKSYHTYRIIAKYPDGELKYSEPQQIYLPEYVPKVRGYYLGSPQDIPGTIEAENFDTGGEGLTWHEATPANLGGAYRVAEAVDIFPGNNNGYYISNVWPGEWFEHTVNVASEDDYIIDFHIAAKQAGGTFVLTIGNSSTGTITAPSTESSINTTIITDTLHLAAGEQIMRFSILDIPYFSIDKFVFSLVPVVTRVSSSDTDITQINIFQNELVVRFNESSHVKQIRLFDAGGRLISHVKTPDREMHLPVSHLTGGLYVIRVETDKGTESRKVIINR